MSYNSGGSDLPDKQSAIDSKLGYVETDNNESNNMSIDDSDQPCNNNLRKSNNDQSNVESNPNDRQKLGNKTRFVSNLNEQLNESLGNGTLDKDQNSTNSSIQRFYQLKLLYLIIIKVGDLLKS